MSDQDENHADWETINDDHPRTAKPGSGRCVPLLSSKHRWARLAGNFQQFSFRPFLCNVKMLASLQSYHIIMLLLCLFVNRFYLCTDGSTLIYDMCSSSSSSSSSSRLSTCALQTNRCTDRCYYVMLVSHAYFSISNAATFLFSYILSFNALTHDALSGK